MKTRDRRVKQDVAVGQKSESKGSRSARGAKHGSKSATTEAALRERGKRSGVDAVKLHLEATGFTGRTSRSATTVGTHRYNNSVLLSLICPLQNKIKKNFKPTDQNYLSSFLFIW